MLQKQKNCKEISPLLGPAKNSMYIVAQTINVVFTQNWVFGRTEEGGWCWSRTSKLEQSRQKEQCGLKVSLGRGQALVVLWEIKGNPVMMIVLSPSVHTCPSVWGTGGAAFSWASYSLAGLPACLPMENSAVQYVVWAHKHDGSCGPKHQDGASWSHVVFALPGS